MNIDELMRAEIRRSIEIDKLNPQSKAITEGCLKESMRAAQNYSIRVGFDIADPQELTFVLALAMNPLSPEMVKLVLTVFGLGLLHKEKNTYEPGSENDLH